MSEVAKIRIPTDEEVAALDPVVRAEMAAAFLRGLEPGRQPQGLFKELSRLSVSSTVEIVPVRKRHREPEIWLGQRSESDPWWPGKWALPGVVIQPNDARDSSNSLSGPIKRLFEDELKGIDQTGDLHQLPSQFRHDGRSVEVTTQYWTRVETGDDTYPGQFFNVDELRSNEPDGGVLEESWLTIDRAIADYERLQAS